MPNAEQTIKSYSFTPPASSGDSNKFLTALHTSAKEYQTYQFAHVQKKINESSIAVTVINNLHKFSETGNSGLVPPISAVSDKTRARMTAKITRSISKYLAQKYRVTSSARLRIVIMVYGNGETWMGGTQLTNSTNSTIDLGTPPLGGMISLRIFLLDTHTRQILWYSNEAWAYGKDEARAAEFASENIIARLRYLFGESHTP